MSRFAKAYLLLCVFTAASAGLAVAFGSMAEEASPGLARNVVVQMTGRNAGETSSFDETFEIAEDFAEVDVKSEAGDVEIVAVEDGARPRVRFVGTAPKAEAPPFGYKVERGELKIETKHAGWFAFVMDDDEVASGGGSDIRTVLELPKSWKGSIDVVTVGGDARIGPFGVDELEVKTVSGDVDTDEHLAARELKAKTVSGDMKLLGRFRDVQAEAISGEISLGLPRGGEWSFDVKTVSGRVQNALASRKGKVGRVNIKTVSGDVIITPIL